MNTKLGRLSVVWMMVVNPVCVFASIYMMRKDLEWAPVPAVIGGIGGIIFGVLLLKNK